MPLNILKSDYIDIAQKFNKKLNGVINIRNFEGSILVDSENLSDFITNLSVLVDYSKNCLKELYQLTEDLVELQFNALISDFEERENKNEKQRTN